MFTSSPSVTRGSQKARIAEMTPVMIVIRYGVRKRVWTRENHSGSRLSRLMAKATRLWPRIRIITTTVSPMRIANETTNCAAGKGVAARAVAAGAAVPSSVYGTSPVKTMDARK